jgi:hypothetical protein
MVRLGAFKVDDQLEFCRLLDRKLPNLNIGRHTSAVTSTRDMATEAWPDGYCAAEYATEIEPRTDAADYASDRPVICRSITVARSDTISAYDLRPSHMGTRRLPPS